MPSPIDLAWLIPVIPFTGSFLIGMLLIIFNKTMKRLSKPIAFFLTGFISLSALISYLLLASEMNEEVVRVFSFDFNSGFTEVIPNLEFIIDKVSSICLSAISTTLILIMVLVYFKMYGKKNYITFFLSISILGASLLGLTLTSVVREPLQSFIG